MPAKPSQLLPLALLFLQIFSCVLNAAVVGTQGKIIFKDPASNTTTSYSLLFSSFFSNDVVGTNEGVIGGALIFGLVWPVLLFILTWLIQTDKVENSRAKILIVIILNIVSTLALFIVACVGAAGVTGFCQKEASSTGVVTECQAYIDALMKTPGYSAAISYPMFSALSAAYAFEFIATFLSGLYTGLKVVEYRELGGKVSLDGIRMMLPSNGGGYKRQR